MRMKTKLSRRGGALGWLLALQLAACALDAAAADRPYSFGVFPYLPVTKIHEMFAPIAADFEAKIRRPVRLLSKARYETFEADIRKESYDIAFLQPFLYVDAHDHHGYLPLARRRGKLAVLVVVREDSPVTSLKELEGKTLANPPADAAVSHLTSMALLSAGIDPRHGVRRDYGKNHFTCLQSVLIGVADACGTADGPLHALQKQKQGRSGLRVLPTTADIPYPLFVVHQRVPKADRDALLTTILDWDTTEGGKRILRAAEFTSFVTASDADYQEVRQYLRRGQ